MTDMDFDELDKAVNSLMDEANKTDTFEETDSRTNTTVSNQPSSQPATPLTTKRATGRFMDVMPPSGVRHRPPQPAVSRVGATLGSVDGQQQADNEENQESFAVTEENASQPSVDSPIEETLVAPQLDDITDETGEVAEDVEDIEENNYISPLESPFISGATVTKRPLGAVGETTDIEGLGEEELTNNEPSDNQFAPDTLVPEYSKEILEFESKDLTHLDLSAELPDDTPEQSQVEQPEHEAESSENRDDNQADKAEESVESFDNQDQADDQVAEDLTIAKPAPAVTPPGGDIPQQWSPVVDEPEPAPMFDAAADQVQQLTPVKKKSGWAIFLIIVLFLVLGIAGGAAVYFFLLQ